MRLEELVKGFEIKGLKGSMDIDIDGIAYDSRKVKNGCLFVCIDGTTQDGHSYIPSALERGAKALLVQKEVEVPDGVAVVQIDNTRYGLAHVSDAFFGHPSGKLHITGITGTKGKTTITYMIKSVMETVGKKVGLIGTIANMIGNEVLYAERTTPESYDLQSIFADMLSKGVDNVVMEVSSQGLKLHRVSCCEYDTGIFTNLSRDHIGPREHSSVEDYLESKIKLFKMCKKGLINVDSEYAGRFLAEALCEVLTYGIDNPADIMATGIKKHQDSVEFTAVTPWGTSEIKVNIPGKFSVYNALAAIGGCLLAGIGLEDIKTGLKDVRVRGRAELVETGRDFSVIVDYAHTPDSLENILSTVRDYAKGRVICVFGCGGDRDRKKRPLMGEISGRIADFTVITSDNPRTEVPEDIIRDIEAGIKPSGAPYVSITDRHAAIEYAIKNARPKDVIVIAGKGHETYQQFKDKVIHFDDREVAGEILDRLKA